MFSTINNNEPYIYYSILLVIATAEQRQWRYRSQGTTAVTHAIACEVAKAAQQSGVALEIPDEY